MHVTQSGGRRLSLSTDASTRDNLDQHDPHEQGFTIPEALSTGMRL